MGIISNAVLVGDVLGDAAQSSPDATAYIHNGREIRFREMDLASDRVATALLKLGVERGDRVAVLALNQPEWLMVYFGAAKIGAVTVGLSVRYRPTELTKLLEQCRAKVVVSLDRYDHTNYIEFFDSISDSLPRKPLLFFINPPKSEARRSFDVLLGHEVEPALLAAAKDNLEPDDDLLLCFTSGTTGVPKGAVLTHRSHLASARSQARHMRIGERDRIMTLAPLNHVGGITISVMVALLGRASCMLLPRFTPEDAIREASIWKPTVFFGFPTMHIMLFLHEQFAGLDTRSFRVVVTGGSAATLDLVRRLKDAYQSATIMNLYGLTETCGAAVMSPWNCDMVTISHTVGKPLEGFSVKVIDFADNPVSTGEIGEICIKGPAVVAGYFRRPEESRATFDQDGWLRTGDMGYLDEEGFIVLLGRKNEMYIQEGFNVYPVEVEDCLASHPKVEMAAGIGIPDPVLGEVGRYYVVPKPGEDIDEDELWDQCVMHLADFKRPKQIVIRQELPFTATGKINKSILRKEFEENGK